MKKRLILLLTIFITFMGSFAQQATSTQRLKFMGKSMDCSMSEMATHLKTKGCNNEYKKENVIFMIGTFLGYSNCAFVLREDYGILNFCRVILPNNTSWAKLESDYNNVVYSYTKKYGVPQISKSEFEERQYSDYTKLSSVMTGNCRYYSIFFIEGGTITVSIESSKTVWITYEDYIAIDKIDKIQQDEL